MTGSSDPKIARADLVPVHGSGIWRSILDTALDAVVVIDRHGTVVDWNESAVSTFGWTAHEVIGQRMADLLVPHRLRAAHESGLRRYLETGEATVLGRRIEISAVRRGGEEFPVELSISPLREAGELMFVGFLRDISARRNTERLLQNHASKMEALYNTVAFAAERASFEDALSMCLAVVHKLTGWPLGHVYLPSETHPVRLVPSSIWHPSGTDERFSHFRQVTETAIFSPGEGLPGRVWSSRAPQWISNVYADGGFLRLRHAGDIGIRSAFGFPIVASEGVIAIVEFFSEEPVDPDPDLLKTLRAVGEQVGRVFERRRSEDELRRHAEELEAEVKSRLEAEAQLRLLVAEVNHRVKNTLAVVNAIAVQTGRRSRTIEEFNQAYSSRLAALGLAHSLLTVRNWQPTSLTDLATQLLAPHQSSPSRIRVKGPEVLIPPKMVLSITMVLHELITNALKYGALGRPTGAVAFTWQMEEEPEAQLRVWWQESGAGPVSKPDRSGFGTDMIRASVRHDLNGSVETTHSEDGIGYEFVFPLRQKSNEKQATI